MLLGLIVKLIAREVSDKAKTWKWYGDQRVYGKPIFDKSDQASKSI